MFFNLFAQRTVGGDVSRVYYLARDEKDSLGEAGWAVSTVPAAVSVFMDRAVGMAVLHLAWRHRAPLIPRVSCSITYTLLDLCPLPWDWSSAVPPCLYCGAFFRRTAIR